ncbi:MAG: hypothetical protein IPM02_13010 [Betaproteobacteria bacterium]|nr:hypothetical protein [Betaproteobacteria bacterium]
MALHPQNTSFFYPEEEYRAEHLDEIAAPCREGYGEIEASAPRQYNGGAVCA